ncbi:MAG: hypothetical protein HY920_08195 [Elusimicrobia bacterium]|nr:hypothetical protein [Elusimicrobiota bacterium]
MNQRNETEAKKLTSEDMVILVVTGMGFLGSVGIYLLGMPPIIVAVFLATGLATVVYRFLGGIRQTTFVSGTLKITGTAAFLIGSAWFINGYLVRQTVVETKKPIEQLALIRNGDKLKVVVQGKPDSVVGTVTLHDLRQCAIFNTLDQKLENFIVTERLAPNSADLDLNPIPFRISTGEYGSEYSRYALIDKDGVILHKGAIYRRQAEIVTIAGKYYLVAVTEVNHNPKEGEGIYAKFAIGEIVTNME